MASASLYPSIDLSECDLWEFLFEGERKFPEGKVLFLDPKTSRQYTFQDVRATAEAFGHALLSQWNWQRNDAVLFYSPNCIDTPALTFGALWAGGVASPANPLSSAKELAFQLKDSGSKALVTQVAGLKTALEAAKIVGLPKERILSMGDDRTTSVEHFTDFIAADKGKSRRGRIVAAPHDLSFLVYSSGTTGLPKGVMLTHRNIIFCLLGSRVPLPELSPKDTIIAVLPFCHIYGLAYLVINTLYIGVLAIVHPSFSAQGFCSSIQKYRVTYAYVVPPILLYLSKSPDVSTYNLRSIQVFMSAAAPLATDLITAVYQRLGIPTIQAYGLSETSPAITIQRRGDWLTSMGSVGRLLPNVSMRITTEAGSDVEAGREGELWVKGPNVFAGYVNNDAATQNCMTADGFFKTGDLGVMDANGNLFVTDRLKELIKYKAFQVAPAELEAVLIAHEKVADACVLGLYDAAQATELPRAYIVRRAVASTSTRSGAAAESDEAVAEQVRTWTDGKVASYKRLRGGIVVVDSIPKSAAGKILRRVLRDRMKEAEQTAKAKL